MARRKLSTETAEAVKQRSAQTAEPRQEEMQLKPPKTVQHRISVRLPKKAIAALEAIVGSRGRSGKVREYLDALLSMDQADIVRLLFHDMLDAGADNPVVTISIDDRQNKAIQLLQSKFDNGEFQSILEDDVEEGTLPLDQTPIASAFVRVAIYQGLLGADE